MLFYVTVIERESKDESVLGIMEGDSKEHVADLLEASGYSARDYEYKITRARGRDISKFEFVISRKP